MLSVHHRVAPAAINIDDFDPAIDLDVVRGEHRALPQRRHCCLNNSFGFGGHNVALVIKSVWTGTAPDTTKPPASFFGGFVVC